MQRVHRPNLRRFYRCLATAAACGLALVAAPAHAQFLEFTGAQLRGRLDQPNVQNVWTVGDNNGNGILDDDEQFATRLDVDDAFLASPGRAFITTAPQAAYMMGTIDVLEASGGPFQPDGLADDIEADGQFGPDGYDTEDPGRQPDVLFLNNDRDFDDTVHLPASYESVGRNSFARFGGAHLMQVLRFEGDPDFTFTTAHETLELGYGARFLSGYQDLRISGSGGTLGETRIDSSIDNQALGPQVSVKWALRHGPWRAHAEAAAAMTYMSIDADQSGGFALDAVQGQYNRGLWMTPTSISNHLNEWDVAPTLEAGLLASYDVTPTTLCFIRCDAIQFGNIRHVEQSIVYRLPTMGLTDPGGRDVTITAASIGLELRR